MAVIVAALRLAPRPRARARSWPWPGSASPGSLLVAVMTERGYAGNQRYLIVTTAALCVLGGIGVGPHLRRHPALA